MGADNYPNRKNVFTDDSLGRGLSCPFVDDMVFLAFVGLAPIAITGALFSDPLSRWIQPFGGWPDYCLDMLLGRGVKGPPFIRFILSAYLSWSLYLVCCGFSAVHYRRNRLFAAFHVLFVYLGTIATWALPVLG